MAGIRERIAIEEPATRCGDRLRLRDRGDTPRDIIDAILVIPSRSPVNVSRIWLTNY